MRLDRAGSIRLRVGPTQIAPKFQKERVRNQTRFFSRVFSKKVPKMSKVGSQMGSVWMLLAHFLRSFFETSKKGPSE